MFAKKSGRSLAERYREHRAKRRMKKEEKNRFKMVPDKKKSYKWLMIPVSFVLLLALIVYTLYDNGRIIVDYVTAVSYTHLTTRRRELRHTAITLRSEHSCTTQTTAALTISSWQNTHMIKISFIFTWNARRISYSDIRTR